MKPFSRRLPKIFLVAFTIYVVNLQASQSGVEAQAQETAIQDKTVEEFKQLVQEVLSAEKPSYGKRGAVCFFREFVKIGGPILAFMLIGHIKDIKAQNSANAVIYNALPLVPFLCDRYIASRDNTLVTFQKLEMFVSQLTPEQKVKLNNLFKDYMYKLVEKIQIEKDDPAIGGVIMLGTIFDLLIASIYAMTFQIPATTNSKSARIDRFKTLEYSCEGEADLTGIFPLKNNTERAAAPLVNLAFDWREDYRKKIATIADCQSLFILATDLSQNFANAWYTSDYQKAQALAHIAKMLTEPSS